MEFCEKLQQLRKSRNLTQEELAEALYVSRTAVSKWESGRGYPSIDSLKEISAFFSVSIDDLLSGEKLLSIAEKEHHEKLRNICDLLLGMADLCSFLLIVLPIYPKNTDGFISTVSLLQYTDTTALNLGFYWVMFTGLMLLGTAKVILTQLKKRKWQPQITVCSMALSIASVIVLALTRGTYAVTLAFLLLVIKGALLFSCQRHIP